MKKGISLLILMLGAVLFSNCATIIKGKKEDVSFESKTVPVDVHIDGEFKGKTPLKVKLSAKQKYKIEFKKDGETIKVVDLDYHWGWGYFVVDLIMVVWPVAVDWLSDAWYTLDENKLVVDPSNIELKGQFFTLSMKLLDVETAAVMASSSRDSKNVGQFKGLTKEMMNEVLKEMPTSKNRVAVISDTGKESLKRLTIYVEDEIVASKKFVVVERAAIDTILKEQKFSSSDLVDEKKAVQLGKLLGVNKIVLVKVIE